MALTGGGGASFKNRMTLKIIQWIFPAAKFPLPYVILSSCTMTFFR